MPLPDSKHLITAELAASSAWKYRPGYAGTRIAEKLLENEFISEPEKSRKLNRQWVELLCHAYDHVPHYRLSWFRNRIRRRQLPELDSLTQIPMLTKAELISRQVDLRATHLMPGHRMSTWSRTSGTTGQPVAVLHSDCSAAMFACLKQRELRWFRFDPMGTHFSIRPGEELALEIDGSKWPDGRLLNLRGWPYLQDIFQTGPAFGFASTNAVEDQLAMLQKVKPDYLLTEPATLENLSMQSLAPDFLNKLRGLQTISQTLTESMRASAAEVFKHAVKQNYGLNEIGLVASMCQHGRYHVHEEHCLVELITDQGIPATPGERGKLVITSLTNSAMPLIRYDTEDSAEMCANNCACGRTLKSFTAVEGRYRRLAQLPPGSYQRFKAVQATINRYARNNPNSVQRYQVCQLQNGEFQIILRCSREAIAALEAKVTRAFNDAHGSNMPPLSFQRNGEFKGLEKRKFQVFYSEYMPAD